MQLRKQHLIATALVAATVVPYLGYAIAGEMPLVQDARGMGVIGLVLGAIAFFTLGAKAFGTRRFGTAAGVVALVLGVTAAVLETGTASGLVLGAFIVVMVAMLAIALLGGPGGLHGRGTHRRVMPRHT